MGEGRGAQLYSGRQKLFTLLRRDHPANGSSSSSPSPVGTDEDLSDNENYDVMSPAWNHPSPYVKSPWSRELPAMHHPFTGGSPACGLVGSMVREEGHVYSLAAAGGLLYTGSDSKNIRVWKEQREFSGFKSSSGLVKAIVVAGGKIYTGHQDGKIRVWRASTSDVGKHRRVGTLPTLKDVVKSSLNPHNYVEVRRRRSSIWLRHFDAVSCLSVDEEEGLLYSGSWDKTVKVWRLADSKCLESITAHDDAVNTVVAAGFDSLILTGSADGAVKVWRREASATGCRHVLEEVLMGEESPAATALAVCPAEKVVYGGSSDGSVNVWERKGKRMVHAGSLLGHKLAVLCVAAAGSLVFSGSADKTICVWRRNGGGGGHSWVAALSGHGGPVKCLAVEEEEVVDIEGRRRLVLYSGSLDRSVKVWEVAAAAVAAAAAVKEKTSALPLVG